MAFGLMDRRQRQCKIGPHQRKLTNYVGSLGLNGYYIRFVKYYGMMAQPLTIFLKYQFQWSLASHLSFEKLKIKMTKLLYWFYSCIGFTRLLKDVYY